MSITITKEPSGIYPAYNDAFVLFTSDLLGHYKAEVSASPASIFPKTFILYPDASGEYVFNLKEVVKTILNASNFEDNNFFDDAYYKSITGLYLLQIITIKVFNASTDETLVKNYEFFKSVKQIEDSIYSNPFQILSNSKNGVDYYLTYFEGFPFHFDIQRVLSGKDITVKNVGSSDISDIMTTTEDGSFRFNVDRSNGENWTASNFLPLITGLNQLEIYEEGVFKTNLFLKKKKKCSGVLLKWFNSDGGYSQYLFDEYYTEEIKGKDIDFIGSNEFLNVGELDSNVKSIGKKAGRGLILKTKCDANEVETLKSLYSSPLVQMYTSKVENIKGKFINVRIDGSFNHKNKRFNNEFVLNVMLPEMITAKL